MIKNLFESQHYATEQTIVNQLSEADAIVVAKFAKFKIISLAGQAGNVGGGIWGNPNVYLKISDNRNGNWYDNWIRWANIIGTAERPFYLPVPVYVLKFDKIYVKFINQDPAGGAIGRLQINFNGSEVK